VWMVSSMFASDEGGESGERPVRVQLATHYDRRPLR
jgi:hypothetical protein